MSKKDPSFLFYVNDFLSGVMFMTNEQVGIYIKLLCIQHQHGGIIKKEVFDSVVNGHKAVKDKFIETEDGYFNVKMSTVMEERAIKSNNLSLNAQKRWSEYKAMQKQCNCNASAMPTKDVNVNKDVNKTVIKKGVVRGRGLKKPTLEQVREYCKEARLSIDPDYFYHSYESSGWIKANGQPVKNWKSTLQTWESRDKAKGKDLTKEQKKSIASMERLEERWKDEERDTQKGVGDTVAVVS
jgi:hypothetical protein